MVVVVVGVGILLRTDVLHLQDVTTLWAALNWAVARHLYFRLNSLHMVEKSITERTYSEPDGNVGISGVASAASVLFFAERLDDNRVIERACISSSAIDLHKFSLTPKTVKVRYGLISCQRSRAGTFAGSI
jgi:hypothetical protein